MFQERVIIDWLLFPPSISGYNYLFSRTCFWFLRIESIIACCSEIRPSKDMRRILSRFITSKGMILKSFTSYCGEVRVLVVEGWRLAKGEMDQFFFMFVFFMSFQVRFFTWADFVEFGMKSSNPGGNMDLNREEKEVDMELLDWKSGQICWI